MPGTREIKRRIKSVKSTKKITRAMQMISAVKMRKAQQAVLSSRSYSDLAWQIVSNLVGKIDPEFNALLKKNEQSNKVAIVLISSNRGMVGGFNSNLINSLNKFLQAKGMEAEVAVEVYTLGKKGRDSAFRGGKNIVAEFKKEERLISLNEILPVSKLVMSEYLKGTYREVILVYNHFISTINQKPVIKQILPLRKPEKVEDLPKAKNYQYDYLFEPNPEIVLKTMIPRVIESQIYQAVLESDASEHSARMIMMKNATDAANDLIDDLTLAYNQLRQAGITKELAEITAGRIAING